MSKSLTTRPRAMDALGISASVLCAVHCAALPVLLAVFPSLPFASSCDDGTFHQVMAALVAGLGLTAFLSGYRRHRRLPLLLLASLGLAAIFVGAFAHELLPFHSHAIETGITLFGSLTLVSAHILNLRFCRNCSHGHGSDGHGSHGHSAHGHSAHEHSAHEHGLQAHAHPGETQGGQPDGSHRHDPSPETSR